MGNIINPDNYNSFINLVKFKESEIFVDKTEFIEKMSSKINTQNRFIAITRPRRFGKTVTAHMDPTQAPLTPRHTTDKI